MDRMDIIATHDLQPFAMNSANHLFSYPASAGAYPPPRPTYNPQYQWTQPQQAPPPALSARALPSAPAASFPPAHTDPFQIYGPPSPTGPQPAMYPQLHHLRSHGHQPPFLHLSTGSLTQTPADAAGAVFNRAGGGLHRSTGSLFGSGSDDNVPYAATVGSGSWMSRRSSSGERANDMGDHRLASGGSGSGGSSPGPRSYSATDSHSSNSNWLMAGAAVVLGDSTAGAGAGMPATPSAPSDSAVSHQRLRASSTPPGELSHIHDGVDLDSECRPTNESLAKPPLAKEVAAVLRQEKYRYLSAPNGSASALLTRVLQALDIEILVSHGSVARFQDIPVKTKSGKIKKRNCQKLVSARRIRLNIDNRSHSPDIQQGAAELLSSLATVGANSMRIHSDPGSAVTVGADGAGSRNPFGY